MTSYAISHAVGLVIKPIDHGGRPIDRMTGTTTGWRWAMIKDASGPRYAGLSVTTLTVP